MSTLPNDSVLIHGLSSIFLNYGNEYSKIKIVDRTPSVYASTFPVEIVKCLIDNRETTLFCKYLNGLGPNSFGHRGAVEYEAKVYDKILNDSPFPTVKFYGTSKLETSNDMWMVLEYLENASQLQKSTEENALQKAVLWIAGFHSFYEEHFTSFLTVYDENYYNVWISNVENLIGHVNNKYPWLANVCQLFWSNINILTKSPLTIIHGEYYPKNILVVEAGIYPIDWESAAVAPGEIDLVSILEGQSEIIASQQIENYAYCRWRGKNFSQKDFKSRILMSQIYYQLRWIGEAKINELNSYSKRFDKLKYLGEKLAMSN